MPMNRIEMEGPSWRDTAKCTGRGCPRAEECARLEAKKGPTHFLTPPWDRGRKTCTAFKKK